MMIDKNNRQQEEGNRLLEDPSCENLLMPSRPQQHLLVHSAATATTVVPMTNENSGSGSDTNDINDINDPKKHNYCGLCCCRPRWLQPFASKQVFLAVFGITWVLQGMYYTYFVSVITTIEKLFQIQSKTTGVIMSATEIGQIGSSLLLTYYGGQGHRPKWIAWSMILFAISSFTCSLPHFIYGKQLMQANNVLLSQSRRSELAYPTAAAQQSSVSRPISLSFTAPIADEHDKENNYVANDVAVAGDAYFASLDRSLWSSVCETNATGRSRRRSYADNSDECNSQPSGHRQSYLQVNRQIHEKITKVVLTMFFLSLLGVGMGQTAINTLGIPFIDDNVANKESPLYFAITIGLRILGPALGFVLGSFCTRMYADLSIDPEITPKDPRWIGAWWLGLVIVSPLLIIASFAMFCFPRHLNGSQSQSQSQPQPPMPPPHLSSIKSPAKSIDLNFRTTVKRLLKNEILMYRTASSVLHILPIAGFYTFLPKYLESQFHLAAHSASMVSGIGGIMVMGIGIIGSGVFILRFKPNARFIAGWIAVTALIYSVGMGILSFIGCPNIDVPSFQSMDISGSNRGPLMNPTCSWHCDCDRDTFNPVCGRDGQLYFSACHAGCRNVTERIVNDSDRSDSAKLIEFHECNCITNATRMGSGSGSGAGAGEGATPSTADAVLGYCNADCQNAVWYIGLFSFFVFVHSTSEVGSMLLILRCVDPKDKAMALGLIQFAIGLFGNVPCPIIYGAIVDYACLVWEKTCGQKGACWLYDPNIFRVFFHGVTGLIFLSAFVIDVIVWYKSGSIKFLDDNTSTIGNCNADVKDAATKSHESSELLQLSDSKSFDNENN